MAREILTDTARADLLRRMSGAGARTTHEAAPPERAKPSLDSLEFYRESQLIRSVGAVLQIESPFFQPHETRAGARTQIGGRVYANFSSYDYLGLNGHPEVCAAAKAAVDRYGTSASASRIVAGERPVHGELEERLAALHGAEACVAMVSGHATNVTVIGHLLGRDDLIVHDALIHNSVVQGAKLSGAQRLSFPHGDVAALEQILLRSVSGRRRVLIVVESHYSMDGDAPDLRPYAALARRHGAWLMVDEAHAVGVLGATGRGAREHWGLAADDVDLWMGTLSKTLAGCGGYIAASRDMVDYLKVTAPGFVYSVGLSPPLAAASLAALQVLDREPERVTRLNANARLFRDAAVAAGLDVGVSDGHAIVPIVVGSSILAARLSQALMQAQINVQPILFPAVPERSARLRFFLSSEHTPDQLNRAVSVTAEQLRRLQADPVDLAGLSAKLGAL